MRRKLGIKFATLVVVVLTTAAPAFAAPREDSPVGGIERAVTRVVMQLKKILIPAPNIDATIPKPAPVSAIDPRTARP
jgi:hypothetical protein